MIHVKEVSSYSGGDYEFLINDTIHTQDKRGWRFIDIKHSVAANSGGGVVSSALLIFNDSPTADTPISLKQ